MHSPKGTKAGQSKAPQYKDTEKHALGTLKKAGHANVLAYTHGRILRPMGEIRAYERKHIETY
jgi:hypothetical protein